MVVLGNTCVGAHVGHINFMLFVSFTPALLANVDVVSGGIWAFIVRHLGFSHMK